MIFMLGGLRAVIFLFAIWLGNNFSLQAFDGISCHFLVDNFISYGWLFHLKVHFQIIQHTKSKKKRADFAATSLSRAYKEM